MSAKVSWRILFVLWQAWGLNVFLPAHTRGAMTVGGQATKHPCCATKHSDRDEKPTPEQQSRCAVCYFAAGLSVSAVVDCGLVEAGIAELLPAQRPEIRASTAPALAFYSCGPPALG